MLKRKVEKNIINSKKIVYVTGTAGDTHAVHFNNPNRVHPALKNHFGYCLFKVANKMRTMLDLALVQHHFQSIHYGILSILNQGDVISQIHMGDEMGIDKASMVKLIDKLESLKLVERHVDPKDRRIKLLKITTTGKSVFAKAQKIANKTESALFKTISLEEQAFIKKILPQLLTKD